MSGTVRKLAVVVGFVACTVVVSSVAGAGFDRASGAEARAVIGEDGPEARSVAGEQYSGKEDKAKEEKRGVTQRNTSRQKAADSISSRSIEKVESRKSKESSARDGADSSGAPTSAAAIIPEPRDNLGSAAGKERPRGKQDKARPETYQRPQQRVSRESDSQTESKNKQAEATKAKASRSVQSAVIKSRVKELRKKERAGELRAAATSYNKDRRRQELRIAREQIVAEPVDEASLRKYKKLYEDAAEEYGFGEDWYVLAAVGKVESDHGENMGPSSAGALGPMQFMPSTWDSYGLDANNDGRANIMDPEDAIPAAARYLRAGGAPDDWYEALYTYNHAGWYVEKVLKVAERYRQAAGDSDVGPYYPRLR